MKSHKDLDVWKGAVTLAREVYEATRAYPKEEILAHEASCVQPQRTRRKSRETIFRL